jgi:hypothetical protein
MANARACHSPARLSRRLAATARGVGASWLAPRRCTRVRVHGLTGSVGRQPSYMYWA